MVLKTGEWFGLFAVVEQIHEFALQRQPMNLLYNGNP